jgi:polyhydroxybutyrate depolymerase
MRKHGIIALLMMVVLSGCGRFDRAGKESVVTMTWDGLSRKAILYTPKALQNQREVPVVIFLHGGGGKAENVERYGIREYADQYGFILVAPDGTGSLPLHTWNGGSWQVDGETQSCCGSAVRNDVDDVGFIDALIDRLIADYAVDPDRIYVTGFSNGAIMGYRVACELSDRVAAVAVAAPPGLTDDCDPSRAIPLLHMIGTDDDRVPIDGGEGLGFPGLGPLFDALSAQTMIDRWATLVGAQSPVTTVVDEPGVVCTQRQTDKGVPATLCVLEGMGHRYPGANPILPEESKTEPLGDFDFDAVWSFLTTGTP